MDYLDYDDQNQPSQRQQQPHSTASIPHHPNHSHHQPAMNHSFPQHLQLQPVSQQHGAYLQPHHPQSVAASTAASPHLQHLPPAQGGLSVPFLHHGAPLGFASGRGGEGATERSILHQDVPPISHRVQVRGVPQVMDSIFSSVIQEVVDPSVGHLEPPAQSSLEPQPQDPSTPRQLPSHSTATPTPPTTTSTQSTTPTQPSRPPLSEKPARIMVNDGNLHRKNASQKLEKTGNVKKPMLHAILPQGFSYQFADKGGRTIKGVVVDRFIQKSQWFGPFNGTLLDGEAGEDIGSTWELCLQGNVWFYLDGKNKIHNNWLHHINPARTKEEQNLEAFQHYGDIYFRALDNVQPGTELKVFYSDEYMEKIGCSVKLKDLGYDKEAGCFRCHRCRRTYNTSKSMLRHIKFSHSKEDHTPSRSSNLKERISKKARLMESLKQPLEGRSHLESPETSWSKEPPPCDQEEHFVCVTCGKHFPTNGRLKAHERFHESTCEKFECDMCNAVFKTSLSLMRHKKTHTEVQFKCTMCFKKYTCRSHLSRHMHTAHGFERVRGKILCMGCSRKFLLEDDMLKHLKSCKGLQTVMKERTQVSSEDDDNNDISGRGDDGLDPDEDTRNTAKSLERRGKVHVDRESECSLCHKHYSSRSHLSRHMHTVHGFERVRGKIVCMGCSKMFCLEDNMSQHLQRCKGLRELLKKKKNLRKISSNSDDDDDDGFIPNEEEESCGVFKALEGPDRVMGQSTTGDLNETVTFGVETNKQGEDNKRRVIDMLGVRSFQDASKPFKCSYCTKRFLTKNRLLRHKHNRHPKSSVFKCDHCDQTFPYKHRLLKHLPTHNKDKRYKCQLCPRSFASEIALSNHQEEHTDARPHKCEPCIRAFRTRKLLLSHNRRIHAVREMRFACSFCDKKFPERTNLVLHERRHKGIRPHVCLACGKAFTSKHCLITHMRVHTGEKPFKCNICGKCFPLNHHLEQHLMSHSHQGAQARSLPNANYAGNA